jgi:hypothetical protein
MLTRWSRCALAALRPLEPPGAYKSVPRRVLGHDGHVRDTSG